MFSTGQITDVKAHNELSSIYPSPRQKFPFSSFSLHAGFVLFGIAAAYSLGSCSAEEERASEGAAPGQDSAGNEILAGPWTYPVPMKPPIFILQRISPCATLVGFDLRQGGALVSGDIPRIEAGAPLNLTLYWQAQGAIPPNLRARVNLRGPGAEPGPGFVAFEPFGFDEWQFGHVYSQEIELKTWKRGHVGTSTLNISLWPEEGWARRSVQFVGPAFVPAATWQSSISDAAVDANFGTEYTRAHAGTRLGPGTSIELPINRQNNAAVDTLGIISNLHFADSLRAGELVCRVELIDSATGMRSIGHIQLAHSTGRANDANETAVPPVAYTEEREDAQTGKNVVRRYYAGRIPLTDSVTPDRITLTYTNGDGFLDIQEIVLLPPTLPSSAK